MGRNYKERFNKEYVFSRLKTIFGKLKSNYSYRSCYYSHEHDYFVQ
ncbi:MAG: hypothetical protein H5T45_05870 [Thermoplasmatales archaeon]|nr:hypothetical protein [Thermoplasmatales archaeon]